MKLFIVGLIFSSVSVLFADETRLIELEPDEAAQIINKQDQSLKYAPKIESNVPGVRFIGDHPEHVVEDIYLANQYHGQDGLGAYVYGYAIPDIAKTEKKERSGDLKGAYNYISGDGQEIKVQYWDDGTGFHQIDNVPKIQPKQVEDSPEVKAAKEEHLRIWQEQAERNSHPIADPYADSQYNQPQPGQSQYQQSQPLPQPYASQNQGVTHYQAQSAGQPAGAAQQYSGAPSAHAQGQQSAGAYQQSYGQAQQSGQVSPNSVEYSGQYSANQQAWAKGPGAAGSAVAGAGAGASAGAGAGAGAAGSSASGAQHSANQYSASQQSASQQSASQYSAGQYSAGQYYGGQGAGVQGSGKQNQQEEQEENGPPKGFFYAFDYPVGIIVGREGKNLEAYYNQNKDLNEKLLRGEAPRPSGASSSYHASA